MKTTVQWKGNRLFMGTAPSGHQVLMDGPVQFGGNDSGVRPMELLLLGLGGCSAFDVVNILEKKRMLPEHLVVEMEAERSAEHPKVFTRIHMHFKLSGASLTEKAVSQAIHLSETRFCSVAAMLGQTAGITTAFTIEETVKS